MATGKQHARATRSLIIPCGVIAALVTKSPETAVSAALGCSFGLICYPDLDVNGLTASQHKMLKKIPIFGFLWIVCWYPYALALKHRSPWSHKPIIGTFGRIVYICVPVFSAVAIIDLEWVVLAWEAINTYYFLSFFIGLSVADFVHWVMDGLP